MDAVIVTVVLLDSVVLLVVEVVPGSTRGEWCRYLCARRSCARNAGGGNGNSIDDGGCSGSA